MTQFHTNARFDSVFDRGDALTIQSQQFVGCQFENCGLGLTKDIRYRSIVRDVELVRCAAYGCAVGPAILEDVRVKDLATSDLFIIWGAVFNRVVLEGKIGRMRFNTVVDPVDRTERTQGPFDRFRREYYSSIEWAIDIRNARFREVDVDGIPARLVRRDPESQAVVTREKALDAEWRRGVSAWNQHWPFVIDMFLATGEADQVLIAPLGAPKTQRDALLRGLKELRTLGVLEPE